MLWAAWAEEWALAEPVSFDGRNRAIVVNAGVESLTVQAIYSAWKRWAQREQNAMYLPAMRAVGGDPIPGGVTGSTFFMMNGWKVVYDANRVSISGVLYSEDYPTAFWSTAGDPIYPATVSSLVNQSVSVQNVVTGTALTAAETTAAVLSAMTPEQIAAVVLAAAQAAPIHADVRKVNAVPVTGNGQPATPWGPAA
jgi:hypothetical protein